jgi:hypothetical protein
MMALFPWRFQAEVMQGEVDPRVTVFLGPERQALDEDGQPTGDTFVEQVTTDPVQILLSELPTALADPSILMGAKQKQKVSPR